MEYVRFFKEDESSPWERLIAGIIYCAVQDYAKCYCDMRNFRSGKRHEEAVCELYLIERFFESQWCDLLTNGNGEKILRLTKKAAKGGIDCCKLR